MLAMFHTYFENSLQKPVEAAVSNPVKSLRTE
jgi:hypothetical protein